MLNLGPPHSQSPLGYEDLQLPAKPPRLTLQREEEYSAESVRYQKTLPGLLRVFLVRILLADVGQIGELVSIFVAFVPLVVTWCSCCLVLSASLCSRASDLFFSWLKQPFIISHSGLLEASYHFDVIGGLSLLCTSVLLPVN